MSFHRWWKVWFKESQNRGKYFLLSTLSSWPTYLLLYVWLNLWSLRKERSWKMRMEIFTHPHNLCLLRAICLRSLQQLAAGIKALLRESRSSGGVCCSQLCFVTLRTPRRVKSFYVHPKSRHTLLVETVNQRKCSFLMHVCSELFLQLMNLM